MAEYPFYRLATIGWVNPLLRPTVALLAAPPGEDVLVDLSAIKFIDAFGVTYLAACVHSSLERGCRVLIRPPQDALVRQFLQDVGFFESVGVGGNFPARRPSRGRVDLVHIEALEPLFIDHLLEFLEHLQPFEAGLRQSMRLTLIELVQNFAEHSASQSGAWVSGQFYKHSKAGVPRLTMCVLDLGIGIPGRLRTLQKYRRRGDAPLIELATREGVSSTSERRGRGLSTIRQLARVNRGAMTIVAGKAVVKFKPDRRPELGGLDGEFPGTAVFLSLVPTRRGLYVLEG